MADLSKLQEALSYGKCALKSTMTTTRYHTTRNTMSTRVVVIGCGGTGSRTIPLIAQHIANHNKYFRTSNAYRDKAYIKHEIGLTLIDCDEGLEEKNLLRQNFYAFDLKGKKAEVMARRYSALFGMNIEFFNTKYADQANFQEYQAANAIIFDHTDNKAARMSIEKNLPAHNNVIISTGNEDNFGQVLFSSVSRNNRVNQFVETINLLKQQIAKKDPKYNTTLKFSPTLLELFRGFKDTETVSCVDMVLQNEQSMPVNNLVATLAYNMFYDVISGTPLNYNMVKCNINNTFSTNQISNPATALKLMYQGFYGVMNPDLDKCNECYDVFNKLLQGYYWYRDMPAIYTLIDQWDIMSIPHIEDAIMRNYYLSGEELVKFQNKLTFLKKKLNVMNGLEAIEPIVVEAGSTPASAGVITVNGGD
jgi:hypothetical protein